MIVTVGVGGTSAVVGDPVGDKVELGDALSVSFSSGVSVTRLAGAEVCVGFSCLTPGVSGSVGWGSC